MTETAPTPKKRFDYTAYARKQLDTTAEHISGALLALPNEYANPWLNGAVGGNLHNAIGALVSVRMSLPTGSSEDGIMRVAKRLSQKVSAESQWENLSPEQQAGFLEEAADIVNHFYRPSQG